MSTDKLIDKKRVPGAIAPPPRRPRAESAEMAVSEKAGKPINLKEGGGVGAPPWHECQAAIREKEGDCIGQ